MSVLDRIKSISSIEQASVLSTSKFFEEDFTQTSVPIVNLALSGKLDGGVSSGVTMFAGPSKHFKSYYGLLLVRSYLKRYEDAAVIFYDSEFGSPKSYFNSMGIDPARVFHAPILSVENLKIDLVQQLDAMEKNDHVIVFIDSLGNVASKKELQDAKEGKSVADMTRAKEIKSLFRMVTPYLTLKNVPLVVINHTYDTMELFSVQKVSGGRGSYYASDNIFIVGREQDKDSSGKLDGYVFSLNVEKSRFVKEKSKFKVEVSFDSGINKWSGLIDLAVDAGFVEKGKVGKSNGYRMKGAENFITEAKTNNKEFWTPILENPEFQKFATEKYKLSETEMI